MAEDKAPVRRRRLGAHGMMFRRRRIFAQLREGFTYDEIAAEEGVSTSRIRQIVSQELQQRGVDSGAEHAKLQLDRLAPAVQLGAQGIASGDLSAITPYLKALDRLDRYQTVASAEQVYDDEARKKLMERINRMAENLGINEDFQRPCRRIWRRLAGCPQRGGAKPNDRMPIPRIRPTRWKRRTYPRLPLGEAETVPGFFYSKRP
jgi:hypothetical protein